MKILVTGGTGEFPAPIFCARSISKEILNRLVI